jgi:hypothetical protein
MPNVICPERILRKKDGKDLKEFSDLIEKLGGKAMTRADALDRAAYKESLTPEQERAYYRAYHAFDEHEGNFERMHSYADAWGKAHDLLQEKPAEARKQEAAKVSKGIYYFKTRSEAKTWAENNGWPTDRINEFEKGHAIQAGESGNYAGPNEKPKPGKEAKAEAGKGEGKATDYRTAINQFVEKLSTEHNQAIKDALAKGDHATAKDLSKRASTIAKMSGFSTFTEEAFNEKMNALPKWAKQAWAEFTEKPKFSATAEATPGLKREEVESHIKPISENLAKNLKGGVKVVQTYDELPDNIRKEAAAQFKSEEGPKTNIGGVHDPDTGTIYLVADNIADAKEAQHVILHEGAHSVVDAVHGSDGGTKFFNDLYKVKAEEINPYLEKYGLEKTEEGRNQAAQEWWSDQIASGKHSEAGLKGWWNQYVAMMKNGLRALGFNVKLSDSEISDMARRYREKIGAGEAVPNKAGSPQFSVKGSAAGAIPEEPEPRTFDEAVTTAKRWANRNFKSFRKAKEGIQALGLPPAISPEHYDAAIVMGKHAIGEKFRARESAEAALSDARREFNKAGVENREIPLIENPGMKFASDMSQGRSVDAKFQKTADAINGLFGKALDALEKAGVPLRTVRENYFPGLWTHESRRAMNQAIREAVEAKRIEPDSETPMAEWKPEDKAWIRNRVGELLKSADGEDGDIGAKYFSKRPLGGPESFRKAKVFDDFMTAVEFGLEPISKNPVDLVMPKLAEMYENAGVHAALKEFRETGREKFIPSGGKTPRGWVDVPDRKYADVYGPPVTKIHEAYDEKMMAQLYKIGADLGISHERLVSLAGQRGGSSGAWGLSAGGKILTRFAGPESVVAHEIGHEIDRKYDLWKTITKDVEGTNWRGEVTKTASQAERATIAKELRALADLRFEGKEEDVSDYYKKYVRKAPEKMAVLLESYIHAPEELKRVAPTVWSHFEEFIDAHPELKPLKEIKPGLVLGTAEAEKKLGGFPLLGKRVVPQAVADILENYTSKGLYTNRYFGGPVRAFRAAGNVLNQVQLGVGSMFHGGFVTGEAFFSALAGNYKDVYGLMQGKKGMGDVASGLMHTLTAPYSNFKRGRQMAQAWLNEGTGTEQMQQFAKAYELGGGKYKMDYGLRTHQWDKMMADYYGGNHLKAAFRSPVAATEMLAAPIMNGLVPNLKMGVFSELASRIIADNPSKALEDLAPQFRQAVNRVDARLGQVGYDRLFINRTAKEISQGLSRAPGWTGGSLAEIGGSLKDTAKFVSEWVKTGRAPGELPDRVAYTLALLTGAATINGALTYFLTGDSPKGMDYWAFRTGGTDMNGRPERFVLPTYAKDIYAWATDPKHVALAKTHPLLSMIGETMRNTDYYGVKIRDKDEGAITQLGQLAKYGIKQFEPFWIRGVEKAAEPSGGLLKTPPAEILGTQLGIMPASSAYTKTAAEKEMDEIYQEEEKRVGGRTKAQSEKSNLERDIVHAFRSGRQPEAEQKIREAMTAGKFSHRDVALLKKRMQTQPLVYSFEKLGHEEALRVWDKADKNILRPILIKKKNSLYNQAPERRQQLLPKFQQALGG